MDPDEIEGTPTLTDDEKAAIAAYMAGLSPSPSSNAPPPDGGDTGYPAGPYPQEASGVVQWLAAQYNAAIADQRAAWRDWYAIAPAQRYPNHPALVRATQADRQVNNLLGQMKAYLPKQAVPKDPLDIEYKRAQTEYYKALAAKAAAGSDRDPTAANRLAWEQQWEPEKFAMEQAAKKETAAAAYKQFVEEQARTDARNRLTNTTQFTTNLLDTWAKAAPSAMLPGQQYFLGGEPGGLASRVAQMGGFGYDPNMARPQPYQIDPTVAAEWARKAMGG